MLRDVRFGCNIPVRSVADARRFYEDILGVTPIRIQEREIIYRAGDTLFGIYETEAAGKAGHTLGTFSGVDDIEAVVAELRKRGVVFEEYDMPGMTTLDGIANFGPEKVAWFRDRTGTSCRSTTRDWVRPRPTDRTLQGRLRDRSPRLARRTARAAGRLGPRPHDVGRCRMSEGRIGTGRPGPGSAQWEASIGTRAKRAIDDIDRRLRGRPDASPSPGCRAESSDGDRMDLGDGDGRTDAR